MIYLFIVSIVWAFSFGLIKGSLTNLDSNLVSFIRLFISFIFFAPFLKIKNLPRSVTLKLLLTGCIQYGIMYSVYIYSFQYLLSFEVALFTIFTPIYVTVINDLLNKKINFYFLASSIIAVLGTGIVVYNKIENPDFLTGFVLVQLSNLCFAFGQVYYKNVMNGLKDVKDLQIFGILYLGSLIPTVLLSLVTVNFHTVIITTNQILILLFLGIVATGAGFFIWNYGARKTNTGALSIFNNLKIPMAVAVSVIVFGDDVNLFNLITGGIIVLGSLLLNQYLINKYAANV